MQAKIMKNRLIYLLGLLPALALLSCSGNGGQTIELQSEADLSGLRVVTLAGSSYDVELSKRDDISLLLYNNSSDCLQALITDKADVMANDEIVFNTAIRKDNGVKIAFLGEHSFPTAFMFRKDEADLADTCTAVQRRMIEDGSMQRLKDYWLSDQYAETTTFTHITYETEGAPIRVAAAASTAPIAFRSEDDWYGIEIDLLRELGKELRRPLDIKYYDAASSILALKSGLADVACGCIFVTPEREEEFLFAEPYHDYHPAYFVLDKDVQKQKEGVIAWLKHSIRKNLLTEKRWKYITDGLLETLKISVLAILLGSLLGILLYTMTRSRRGWIRSVASAYNAFLSGIPELVLLLILFYVVFAKSGLPSDIVAVIAFAMFFASGACDIYKTSLDAIPGGQTEAGLALGFTRSQTFFNIVFPQALRRGLPLYKGQCISTLKGTSIVGYIAIQDLTRAGDLIRSRTFDAILPLLLVTVFYFLLVWLIGLLLKLASPKKKVL